jgi:hypothetical protein
VGEAVGEFAIVGQEHESAGFELQPADGKEARRGGVLHEIHDGRSVEAGLIADDREDPLGLVEHDVDVADRLPGDRPAIHDDVILLGIGKGRQFADDLAIDRDAAFLDHGLGDAAGGDAGIGQDALEADGLGRAAAGPRFRGLGAGACPRRAGAGLAAPPATAAPPTSIASPGIAALFGIVGMRCLLIVVFHDGSVDGPEFVS